LRAGDPDDGGRAGCHASRADRCGTLAAIDAGPDVPKDPVPGCDALDLHWTSTWTDIQPDQHRRRRIPDQPGRLGQLINELAERYDLPGTYAAIGFVVLASMLFFVCMEHIERWLQRVRG
jgi:hypothetical protein